MAYRGDNSAPAPPPQTGQTGSATDDQQKIMQMIQEQVKKQAQPQAHANPTPPMNPQMKKMSLGADIGTSLLSMFVPGVGGAVQRAIKAQKEKQIYEAVNDYTSLYNAFEDSQIASGGDKEKANQLFMQDPRTQAILGDKKKSKLLAKAFSVDLTNPEKSQNTAHFQGLKRFADLKQASGQMKQVQGMMDAVKGSMGASQGAAGASGQPQPGPQQPPQGAASAPNGLQTHMTQPSMKDLEEASATMKNIVTAQIEGTPKTEFQAAYKDYMDTHGGKRPSADWIQAFHDARRLKPVDQLVQDAIDLEMAGDHNEAQKKFALAKTATQAMAKTPQPTLMGTIYAANAGDKAAGDALASWKKLQMDLREAYGTGRARWQMIQVMDENGNVGPMSAFDIRRNQQAGRKLTIVGALSTKDIQVAQRLVSEAGPKDTKAYEHGAMKGMYDNISAYDNASDRAIFSKIMEATPRPQSNLASEGYAWASNVLDQALKSDSGLSDKGRNLAIAHKRLNETMGLYRALSGLPSTDQSFDISAALMPSKTTPDSEYAKQQLDSLNEMIVNMINVPIIKPATTQQNQPTPTVPGGKQKKPMNFKLPGN